MTNQSVPSESSNEVAAQCDAHEVIVIEFYTELTVDSLSFTGDYGYSEGWEVSDTYVELADIDVGYEASVEYEPDEDGSSEASKSLVAEYPSAPEIALTTSSSVTITDPLSSATIYSSSEISETSDSYMEMDDSDLTYEPSVEYALSEDSPTETTQSVILSSDDMLDDSVSGGLLMDKKRTKASCPQKFVAVGREDRIVLVETSNGDFEEQKVELSDNMVMIIESSTEDVNDRGVGYAIEKGDESNDPSKVSERTLDYFNDRRSIWPQLF